MDFFRAIYNRTGQGSGLVNQVNIAVPGGSTFDSDWNLLTGSSAADCVLPALTGGQVVVVQNDISSPINIIPPSGATIDGISSFTLNLGKMQIFWYFSSTIIKSTQL
jgi:hypothetical protein